MGLSTSTDLPQRGAYGFAIEGIDDGALAVRGAAGWPLLSVEAHVALDLPPEGVHIGQDRAAFRTATAHLTLDRSRRRISVKSTAPLAQADLVHPCLWPAAAIFARWSGAETLHAGAFADPSGDAWAVLGDRGAGKSSVLAALAQAGHQVLVDDLLVVAGSCCFAGPRCVDLRPESVSGLSLADSTSAVRSTQRHRLLLEPSDGQFMLRGFIHLVWDEVVAIERVTPAEQFGLLVGHRRVLGLGADPHQLLDLAGLPGLRLRRPRRWSALQSTLDALLGAVTG